MTAQNFYVYLYEDPKRGVFRYVGKGVESRPRSHLRASHNVELDRLIKKLGWGVNGWMSPNFRWVTLNGELVERK